MECCGGFNQPNTNNSMIGGDDQSCQFRFMYKYVENLKETGVDLGLIKKRFSNEQEFKAWKSKTEEENCNKFVARRAVTKLETFSKQIYYCSRNWLSTDVSKNKKKVKTSRKSPKVRSCSALMIAYYQNDGSVDVDYYSKHSVHENEPVTNLSKEDKLLIKTELEKTNYDQDLVLSRLTFISKDCKKTNINDITKKDIGNVISMYKLQKKMRIEKDQLASLRKNIDFYEKSELNPFIYSDVPYDSRHLSTKTIVENFSVIVMTREQKNILMTMKLNKVCVIVTDKVTPFTDIKLITLIAIDGANWGYPLAHFYTTNYSMDSIKMFFAKVRDVVGILTVDVFLSNQNECFYEAWCEVMTNRINTKHLKEIWRTKIQEKIALSPNYNESAIADITHSILTMFYSLIDICDRETFMQSFIKLKEYLETYGQFSLIEFLHTYHNICHQWADCYLVKPIFTDSHHLDYFNVILKKKFLKRNYLIRIDRSISGLLQCINYVINCNALAFTFNQQAKLFCKCESFTRTNTCYHIEAFLTTHSNVSDGNASMMGNMHSNDPMLQPEIIIRESNDSNNAMNQPNELRPLLDKHFEQILDKINWNKISVQKFHKIYDHISAIEDLL